MLIRAAESDDIDRIAELYVQNHRETYSGLLPDAYFEVLSPAYAGEKWLNCLRDPGYSLWVALENDRFLGFSAGTADKELPDTWLLDSLHVAGLSRGKGVGTALIRQNASHAVESGFSRMSVCIVRGNENARLLYTKLGAEHSSLFDDSFAGAVSHSEKLIWKRLSSLL